MSSPHPNHLPEPEAVRRGVTLMEVLISIFVLSVGLLGLAALLPVGRFAIVQTAKHDRSGACGRAGLRDLKVQRMLDYTNWSDQTVVWPAVPAADAGNHSFAIDPLGVVHGAGASLGPLARIKLSNLNDAAVERVFRWRDDKLFSLPEDMNPAPADDSDRPRALVAGDAIQNQGNYSWLVTVSPAASEAALTVAQKSLYSVSVVVCYKRVIGAAGETVANVKQFVGGGWGGGRVQLDSVVNVKRNEWVMLCGDKGAKDPLDQAYTYRFCQWYRVVSANSLLVDANGDPDPDTGTPATALMLAGPDWDTTIPLATTKAVVIDSVVGVYTTTVELDRDPVWSY